MTTRLEAILRRRFSASNPAPEALVFVRRYWSGSTRDYVEGSFDKRHGLMRRLCEKAGVTPHFGFHAIRHAGASLMRKNGTPLPVIQRTMGHTSIQTTMVCVHVEDAELQEAMRAFEGTRMKSHTNPTRKASGPKDEKGSCGRRGRNSLIFQVAEVDGNRTHLRRCSRLTPELKTGRCRPGPSGSVPESSAQLGFLMGYRPCSYRQILGLVAQWMDRKMDKDGPGRKPAPPVAAHS
jgi:hypothetical protein